MNSNFIINPDTGRNVKINGNVGEKVLNKYYEDGGIIQFKNYKEELGNGDDRYVTLGCRYSGNPNCHYESWAQTLIKPLLKLEPDTNNPSLVDDHVTSTIGSGYSIGTVAATLEITNKGIDQLPADLREGLFAQSGTYPTCVRFSEAPVGKEYHLARIAAKVDLSSVGKGEMDFTTVESTKVFPLGHNGLLSMYHKLTDVGNAESKLSSAYSLLGTVARGLTSASSIPSMMSANTPDLKTKAHGLLSYNAGGKDYYSHVPFAIDGKKSSAVFKFRFAAVNKHKFFNSKNKKKVNRILASKKTQAEKDAAIMKMCRDTGKEVLARNFRKDTKTKDMEWELQIQLSEHPDRDPINDATLLWNSEFYTVGKLRIPHQDINEEGLSNLVPIENSKRLLFYPGKVHRPVGDVACYRAYVYPKYDKVRQQHLLGISNGKAQKCPFMDMMNNMHNK